MGLPVDPSSLSSGWSGTLGHLSYWRALLMATPGCGKSQMVTARPSRVPAARLPVAEFSLMVREASLSVFLESERLDTGLCAIAHKLGACSQRCPHWPQSGQLPLFYPELGLLCWSLGQGLIPPFLVPPPPSPLLGVSECTICPSFFIHASGPLGKRAVVGYEDGTIRIWDLKQGNPIHVLKGNRAGKCYPGPLWGRGQALGWDSEGTG